MSILSRTGLLLVVAVLALTWIAPTDSAQERIEPLLEKAAQEGWLRVIIDLLLADQERIINHPQRFRRFATTPMRDPGQPALDTTSELPNSVKPN